MASDELFYLEGGKKQDASIHDAILADGDTRGELEALRKRLLALFTEEEVDSLLGGR